MKFLTNIWSAIKRSYIQAEAIISANPFVEVGGIVYLVHNGEVTELGRK